MLNGRSRIEDSLIESDFLKASSMPGISCVFLRSMHDALKNLEKRNAKFEFQSIRTDCAAKFSIILRRHFHLKGRLPRKQSNGALFLVAFRA